MVPFPIVINIPSIRVCNDKALRVFDSMVTFMLRKMSVLTRKLSTGSFLLTRKCSSTCCLLPRKSVTTNFYDHAFSR